MTSLFAWYMAANGTYAPGLEKHFEPHKHNVRIRKCKPIKLE